MRRPVSVGEVELQKINPPEGMRRPISVDEVEFKERNIPRRDAKANFC